jgi:TPR repeat protein
MYLLSTAYSFGLGVEPSLDVSRDWLFRAAEAGNQEALDTVRLLETQGISQ